MGTISVALEILEASLHQMSLSCPVEVAAISPKMVQAIFQDHKNRISRESIWQAQIFS